jgi:purine-binding chemotaxis protein CheW
MIEAWQNGAELEGEAVREEAAQFLCFWLGSQTYALPVGEVQEIRATGAWSTLPGSPPWVLGVMNLRGLVIPMFDLRMRFAIAAGEHSTAAPVLIVVAARGKLAGLVVDAVMDVTDIPKAAIRTASGGATLEARCVSGVASLGDSVVIILDAAALMIWEGTPGAGAQDKDLQSLAEGVGQEGENDVAVVQ